MDMAKARRGGLRKVAAQLGGTKVPVSRVALMARINRKLAKDDEVLRASRGMQAHLDVGDFYIVDVRINGVVGKDVDPVALARKLGVLSAWETCTL
jgi:hypothetical protein